MTKGMTPQEASRQTRALCSLAPVIPVLVIDDARAASDSTTTEHDHLAAWAARMQARLSE